MALFDVHAHLTDRRLLGSIEQILARAQEANVTSILSNGLNPEDNQAVLDLANRFAIVKPALGLYPVDAVLQAMQRVGEEYPEQRQSWPPEEAIAWVEQRIDRAFAVGEIGLDGHWVKEAFWAEQERAFVALVKLALRADKPIIIHTRRRERRALELLDELGARRVNWHCFGGRLSLVREIARRGHYFSIPANARRSESFTQMLKTLPREQLLLETDCPYLGPDRQALNEPSNVCITASYAAELWNTSRVNVEQQFTENFVRLFGVEP